MVLRPANNYQGLFHKSKSLFSNSTFAGDNLKTYPVPEKYAFIENYIVSKQIKYGYPYLNWKKLQKSGFRIQIFFYFFGLELKIEFFNFLFVPWHEERKKNLKKRGKSGF